MLKYFFVFLYLFSVFSLGVDLKPSHIYKADGSVTDIILSDEKILVSTNVGAINVFNIKTKKLVNTITIPKIKDFMGDISDAKIYNLDMYKEKLLFTTQAEKGFREVFLYENNKLTKILSIDKMFLIAKTKFIDGSKILFSTLGNEMYLYDYKLKKTIWMINVKREDDTFNSKFSDFALNEKRDLVVVADESGDLKIVDIKKAKIIKYLEARNLDNVFKVDFKNNKIITAGQDGKCVFYDLDKSLDYYLKKKRWFLIYAAGLSPSGNKAAYSSDEENNVTVFDTKSKKKLYELQSNLMTLSSILFINENEIFVTSDSNEFNYYNLKDK
jgi:WD40 repeat protein